MDAAQGEHARILRVFVASPGDVKAERDVMAHVIERVNDTLGEENALRLTLFRWEKQAVPGLGEPQPQLNPDLDRADIVVAIFWSRLGTIGGAGMTGTQEAAARTRLGRVFGQGR